MSLQYVLMLLLMMFCDETRTPLNVKQSLQGDLCLTFLNTVSLRCWFGSIKNLEWVALQYIITLYPSCMHASFLCTVNPAQGHKLQRVHITALEGLHTGQECDRHVSVCQKKACKTKQWLCRAEMVAVKADMFRATAFPHSESPYCQYKLKEYLSNLVLHLHKFRGTKGFYRHNHDKYPDCKVVV